MDDDFALLARWRAGDLEAGNELFERHFDGLHRFFVNKCGPEAADLVQRTFLAAVEARDRFQGASSFRTFVFAIAHHELIAHYRRRKDAVDTSATSVSDLAPRASTLLVKLAEERLLLKALRAIPIDLQIVLELHYWEGLRGPQLSEVLGVPEGTVRSRLRRGLSLLRARLREDEGSADALTTMTTLEGWARSIAEALVQEELG